MLRCISLVFLSDYLLFCLSLDPLWYFDDFYNFGYIATLLVLIVNEYD